MKAILKFEKSQNLKRRYYITLDFLRSSGGKPKKILDLGTPNNLSDFLNSKGFEVSNTQGEDLDENPQVAAGEEYDAVTAFEIFEHLLNPYAVLKNIKSKRIFISIPLRLWFAKAYRGPHSWDWHYHEFEDWQLDWLLEKTGWKVIRRKKWKSPGYRPGFRPLLRWLYNRYYLIEAVKTED